MYRIFLILTALLLNTTAWANVPAQSPLKNVYSCNSSTTQFPYGFPISATTDMQVWITDANGNSTQQSTSTYSVDTTNLWVNYPLIGSACATGNTLTLLPSTPKTQITSYGSRSPFTATAVGASFDKLTMISQQLQEQLNRTILGPIDSNSQTTLPGAQNGYVLGWSSGALTNFLPNTNTYITTSTDGTFAANSDSLIPTQKATKTYVTTQIATRAASGANSDITSLTALATPLTTGQGGTGSAANSNAANGVVILNGSGQLPALNGSLLTNVVALKNVIFLSTSIDTSAATHDVAITGAGFTPKAVIIMGGISSTTKAVFGMASGTTTGLSGTMVTPYNAGTTGIWETSANKIGMFYGATSGDTATLTLKSFDSDGLTITVTKSGSPSGTADLKMLVIG